MAKKLNIGFLLNAPTPIDVRTKVITYADLSTIPIKYIGLKTYVEDEDKEYRYYASGWQLWNSSTAGGAGTWGDIDGTISNQTDLMTELGKKLNLTGGTLTGELTILGYSAYASNFIIVGSTPSQTGDFIGEAPIDGTIYGRQNELWVPAPGGVSEAPIDGVAYTRKDGSWEAALVPDVLEAPIDDGSYIRKNGGWSKASNINHSEIVYFEDFTLYSTLSAETALIAYLSTAFIAIECKTTHTLGTITYTAGERVRVSSQSISDGGAITGIQLRFTGGNIELMIADIKLFGSSPTVGGVGTTIDPSRWRILLFLEGVEIPI